MPEIEADGRQVPVKNLDKVLFPETGFTKGDLIDYYLHVAEALLPHLRGRPLSMRRFPDGVEEAGFWEKRCPSHRPDWVATARLWSESNKEEIEFCTADDLATLIWAANLADIELHVTLARADEIATPNALVFDLDPGAPAGIVECADVALEIRDLLARLDLDCYAKTSGSKGIQVYLPLNSPVTYEQTKGFAKALARAFEASAPERVVSRMRRDLRAGKVLIDWSQNDEHKTTVCVYSIRATDRPGVSTPVTWDEVAEARDSHHNTALDFSPSEVLKRVDRLGDLFAPVLEQIQRLPDADSLDADADSIITEAED